MNPSSNLLPELLADLDRPDFQWQLLALALCVVGGWLVSQMLMRRFAGQPIKFGSFSTALDSFQRVLTPLSILLLIVVAILVLGRWQTVGLLRAALPLLLSFVLIRLVFYMLRKAFARNGSVGGVLQAFEQLFAVIVWSGLAIYLTGLWPEFLQFLEQTSVPIGRHRESLLVILQALLYVGITLVLALWAAALIEQRLMKLDTMHSSLRAVHSRVGRASLILVAVLVSLSLVGIDLTVLSVFGGALGVGLGLGLQKLVSSYVSGFVILLERSLSIGDIVSVERHTGQVVQINTRYTVIKSGDGTESVIPNELLVSAPVQNLCLSDRNIRVATTVIVATDTDVDALFAAALPLIAAQPRVLAEPAPAALLLRFAPEGLELEFAFWIADPENGKASVLSSVNRALLALLKERGVRMGAAPAA